MQEDKKLNKLLESYIVRDADAELFEKVIAGTKKRSSSEYRNLRIMQFAKFAAMVAITAYIGFLTGNHETIVISSVEKEIAQQDGEYFKELILGAKNLDEVTL